MFYLGLPCGKIARTLTACQTRVNTRSALRRFSPHTIRPDIAGWPGAMPGRTRNALEQLYLYWAEPLLHKHVLLEAAIHLQTGKMK